MSLDGTWSCTVPAGYVYDEAMQTNRCGSPGFVSYEYHLRLAADGVWSCSGVPTPFTYDEVTTSNLCDPSGFDPNIYRLRVPVNGLWACLIPSGWSYTQVSQSSACGTYDNYIYQLAK